MKVDRSQAGCGGRGKCGSGLVRRQFSHLHIPRRQLSLSANCTAVNIVTFADDDDDDAYRQTFKRVVIGESFGCISSGTSSAV